MTKAEQRKALDALGAEFPVSAHKNRSQGGTKLTYIDISETIGRLNDVAGLEWSEEDVRTTITPIITASGTDSDTGETWQEFTYLGEAQGYINIGGSRRFGTGAMVNKDPDMAVKTALAEMRKKAGHAFGIALYLWSEEARQRIEKAKKNEGNPAAQKKALYKGVAEEMGVAKPTLAAVAEYLGLDGPTALDDPAVVAGILAERG